MTSCQQCQGSVMTADDQWPPSVDYREAGTVVKLASNSDSVLMSPFDTYTPKSSCALASVLITSLSRSLLTATVKSSTFRKLPRSPPLTILFNPIPSSVFSSHSSEKTVASSLLHPSPHPWFLKTEVVYL